MRSNDREYAKNLLAKLLAYMKGFTMAAAYVIAQLHIHNLDTYEMYAKPAFQTVLAFGGEIVISRNGRRESLEGEGAIPEFIMAKFPTYEQALNWYKSPDYQALIELRRQAASGSVLLIDGID